MSADGITARALQIMENLPAELRKARESNKVTLRDLGKLIDCAPEQIGRIEHEHPVSGKTAGCCLAFIINTTPGEVFWTLQQAETILRTCSAKRLWSASVAKLKTISLRDEIIRNRWVSTHTTGNATVSREAVLSGYLAPGTTGNIDDIRISFGGMLEVKRIVAMG